MKTAMQELLEYIENNFNVVYPEGTDKKVLELLEKEKKQIMDAFDAGYSECENYAQDRTMTSETYFNADI